MKLKVKVKATIKNKCPELDDIYFSPIFDDDGEIIAIELLAFCENCGELYVKDIFTNGSEYAEDIVEIMGLRD